MSDTSILSNDEMEQSVQRAWNHFALPHLSELQLAQHEIATLRNNGEDPTANTRTS
jgi:hypothetical protein